MHNGVDQFVIYAISFLFCYSGRGHIPGHLGHDTATVATLRGRAANFEVDLVTLWAQVK